MAERDRSTIDERNRSHYLWLINNPQFEGFRNKSWYLEWVESEKGKYDELLAKYPRAAEILDGS